MPIKYKTNLPPFVVVIAVVIAIVIAIVIYTISIIETSMIVIVIAIVITIDLFKQAALTIFINLDNLWCQCLLLNLFAKFD